jgi:hypothetical protein
MLDTKREPTILDKAVQRAIGGGLSGAMAMAVQVVTLIPMRTTMNYQYQAERVMSASVALTIPLLGR